MLSIWEQSFNSDSVNYKNSNGKIKERMLISDKWNGHSCLIKDVPIICR